MSWHAGNLLNASRRLLRRAWVRLVPSSWVWLGQCGMLRFGERSLARWLYEQEHAGAGISPVGRVCCQGCGFLGGPDALGSGGALLEAGKQHPLPHPDISALLTGA